ncbi:carbohydrate kinase family protein [Zongyangia hominis]|uniref:Carbohydrate kinase family protein n=1 Tax=Zongyangia hominis TaxID=2763677 RepID=A0A926EC76_9FIRM|nr:carbohydrate kinase family protein [Zongyangia hominis]MBC8570400.1 carbohydrate kinase family protein [Zongyangia hominis]
MDIVTVGNAVCDMALKPVTKDFMQRDSIRIKSVQNTSGGDALNCAIDCSKLGLDVGICGMIGQDMFGGVVKDNAVKNGVDVSHLVESPDYMTNISFVCIEEDGDRHFLVTIGANDEFAYEHIDMDYVKQAKIVQIGSANGIPKLDGPGLARLFKECKEAGLTTSMDVTGGLDGLVYLSAIEEALPYTDIFLPSFYETTQLTGKNTCEEIEEFFRPYGIKVLAIKLGGDGVYVTDFTNRRYIGTFKDAPVLDTTGCGDSFCAGFLTGIVKGWDIQECAVFGNAVGSCNCQVIGATLGVRNFDETMAFIRENIQFVPEDLRARFL